MFPHAWSKLCSCFIAALPVTWRSHSDCLNADNQLAMPICAVTALFLVCELVRRAVTLSNCGTCSMFRILVFFHICVCAAQCWNIISHLNRFVREHRQPVVGKTLTHLACYAGKCVVRQPASVSYNQMQQSQNSFSEESSASEHHKHSVCILPQQADKPCTSTASTVGSIFCHKARAPKSP